MAIGYNNMNTFYHGDWKMRDNKVDVKCGSGRMGAWLLLRNYGHGCLMVTQFGGF